MALNVIRNWWLSVDWQAMGEYIIATFIKILLATIIFIILHRVGRHFIQFIFKTGMHNLPEKNGRVSTVRNLTLNTYRGFLIFAYIYTILTLFSIPVGSLLAGAGIVGLAISFGAQGLVADIANGIAILLENQLDIGDHILVAGIEGHVVDINLKTTKIKDFDGTIHYVPNREILTLSNKSQGIMRARISLRLFPSTNLDHVKKIIQHVNDELVGQYDEIVTPPKRILFSINLKDQLVVIVDMFTTPGNQIRIASIFIEAYIEALTAANIALPTEGLQKPLS